METQLKQSQRFITTSSIFRSSNFADRQFWCQLKSITEAASCYLLQESLRSITETCCLLHQSRVRAAVYSDKSRLLVEWQDRSKIWEGRYAIFSSCPMLPTQEALRPNQPLEKLDRFHLCCGLIPVKAKAYRLPVCCHHHVAFVFMQL